MFDTILNLLQNRKIMKTRSLILCLTLLFSSCLSIGRPLATPETDVHKERYLPDEFKWECITEGFEAIQVTHFSNRRFPLKYHVVKIDMRSPDIEFVFYPDDIKPDSYFESRRTKKIAREENLAVAVNLSPFENIPNFFGFKSFYYSTKKIIGLHKVNSRILSSPVEEYCALGIKKMTAADGSSFYKARIFNSQTNPGLEKYPDAAGGFFIILHKGEKKSFRAVTHDSRIAAGYDEDCTTLYLLGVEGEFQRESMGLSFPECADIFLMLGCTEAMQFDGGASSQLVVNGKSLIPSPYTPVQGNTMGIRIRKEK